MGMRILPTTSPFGLLHIPVIAPTGSGRAATSLKHCAMPFIAFSERVSLSSIALERPFFSAAERSFAFSPFRRLWLFSSSSAIFKRALFLTPVLSFAIFLDASFAAFAMPKTADAVIRLSLRISCLHHNEVVPVYDLVINPVAQNILYPACLEPLYLIHLLGRVIHNTPREFHPLLVNAVYYLARLKTPLNPYNPGREKRPSLLKKGRLSPVTHKYPAGRAG